MLVTSSNISIIIKGILSQPSLSLRVHDVGARVLVRPS